MYSDISADILYSTSDYTDAKSWAEAQGLVFVYNGGTSPADLLVFDTLISHIYNAGITKVNFIEHVRLPSYHGMSKDITDKYILLDASDPKGNPSGVKQWKTALESIANKISTFDNEIEDKFEHYQLRALLNRDWEFRNPQSWGFGSIYNANAVIDELTNIDLRVQSESAMAFYGSTFELYLNGKDGNDGVAKKEFLGETWYLLPSRIVAQEDAGHYGVPNPNKFVWITATGRELVLHNEFDSGFPKGVELSPSFRGTYNYAPLLALGGSEAILDSMSLLGGLVLSSISGAADAWLDAEGLGDAKSLVSLNRNLIVETALDPSLESVASASMSTLLDILKELPNKLVGEAADKLATLLGPVKDVLTSGWKYKDYWTHFYWDTQPGWRWHLEDGGIFGSDWQEGKSAVPPMAMSAAAEASEAETGAVSNITGQLTEQNDAGYQSLTLTADVNVAEAGTYDFYGELYSAVGTRITVVSFSQELTAGNNSVAFVLSGEDIYRVGHNGQYYFGVYIADSTGNLVYGEDRVFATENYTWDQFAGNGIISYTDNASADKNTLQVNVTVNAARTGNYRLAAWLKNQNGFYIGYAQSVAELEAGQQTITLDFDTLNLALGNPDDAWTISWIQLSDADTTAVLDSAVNAYVIEPGKYGSADFTNPGAVFNGTNTVNAVDLSNDGPYDSLDFTLGVNIAITGGYTVFASLYDADGVLIETYENFVWLNANNPQPIPVSFASGTIVDGQFNGPYTLSGIVLHNADGGIVSTFAPTFAPIVSEAYSWQDFDSTVVVPPPVVAGKPDGTGQTNTATITFDVIADNRIENKAKATKTTGSQYTVKVYAWNAKTNSFSTKAAKTITVTSTAANTEGGKIAYTITGLKADTRYHITVQAKADPKTVYIQGTKYTKGEKSNSAGGVTTLAEDFRTWSVIPAAKLTTLKAKDFPTGFVSQEQLALRVTNLVEANKIGTAKKWGEVNTLTVTYSYSYKVGKKAETISAAETLTLNGNVWTSGGANITFAEGIIIIKGLTPQTKYTVTATFSYTEAGKEAASVKATSKALSTTKRNWQPVKNIQVSAELGTIAWEAVKEYNGDVPKENPTYTVKLWYGGKVVKKLKAKETKLSLSSSQLKLFDKYPNLTVTVIANADKTHVAGSDADASHTPF
ncbi:hypothetical protein FACS1894170_03990 [Planctomycetales bacterium]|nr:hypothetical protein FACS1894170_03990 [Planctomycetales bacterium]